MITAEITGVRPYSTFAQSGRTDVFSLVSKAHPVRLVRMLLGYGAGSSEESIARFFEMYGPVIAIGKPGATNAGILAAQMIGLADAEVAKKLTQHKEKLAKGVEEKSKKLQASLK